MNYEKSCEYMMARARELEPELRLIAQDLRAIGNTEEEIALEICFSLLHEGWRIRDMQSGIDFSVTSDKLPDSNEQH